MRTIKKIKAGDMRVYPFNHAFSYQEKRVFALIEKLKATMAELTTELARTRVNASAPPENYDPKSIEAVDEIDRQLDSLDLQLRWVPGGAYRYE